MTPFAIERCPGCAQVDPDQTLYGNRRHASGKRWARDPVMTNNKLISGVLAVQHWGRGTVLRFLRRPGTRSWKREATILMSILLVLTVGYLTVFRYASYTVQDLVGTCTARLEIELEDADMDPLARALPRSLCECLAQALLDKNGIVRLAMVNRRWFDPLSLEPVTEADETACVNVLWVPNAGLTKRLAL
jgi:hypothetical protein